MARLGEGVVRQSQLEAVLLLRRRQHAQALADDFGPDAVAADDADAVGLPGHGGVRIAGRRAAVKLPMRRSEVLVDRLRSPLVPSGT